jgi:hypothetical protein
MNAQEARELTLEAQRDRLKPYFDEIALTARAGKRYIYMETFLAESLQKTLRELGFEVISKPKNSQSKSRTIISW